MQSRTPPTVEALLHARGYPRASNTPFKFLSIFLSAHRKFNTKFVYLVYIVLTIYPSVRGGPSRYQP